jgi:hypothetical protein
MTMRSTPYGTRNPTSIAEAIPIMIPNVILPHINVIMRANNQLRRMNNINPMNAPVVPIIYPVLTPRGMKYIIPKTNALIMEESRQQ